MNINLTTNYGGLTLKNPIVIGASNLVTDIGNLIMLEQAGAAAIVYKSLFEEQIELESLSMEHKMESYRGWDAEHDSFFPMVKHAGPAEHLMKLKEAKKAISIPLIGSLNCVQDDNWIKFAKEMEQTGIDGLELNFYSNNIDFYAKAETIEEIQIDILQKVRKEIKIPLFVKLSPFYSNPLWMIEQMNLVGANGFVLFNRLFQPDIDIDKEEHHFPYNFSHENDNRLALRYAGLLHQEITGSIISNTGILTGKDVIKMLLAGADAVQVVSAVYRKGIHHITAMLEELKHWMEKKKYNSLEDFRGKLSRRNLSDPFAYKRAQYVDILMKAELFPQYHPKKNDLPNKADDYMHEVLH
jgi:dihydroorotate dehydrogenase (fumarate)